MEDASGWPGVPNRDFRIWGLGLRVKYLEFRV